MVLLKYEDTVTVQGNVLKLSWKTRLIWQWNWLF